MSADKPSTKPMLVVGRLSGVLLRHRRAVLVTLGVLALGVLVLLKLRAFRIRTDLARYYPDHEEVDNDHDFRAGAPFADAMFVRVQAADRLSRAEFLAAAKALEADLQETFGRPVRRGQISDAGFAPESWFPQFLPGMATPSDLEVLAADTAPTFAVAAMAKIEAAAIHQHTAPGAKRWLAPGGHDAFLALPAPVPPTESRETVALLAAFDAVAADLPDGVSATLVSDHAGAVLNGRLVRRDVLVTLLVVVVAIPLLLVLLLRDPRVLWLALLWGLALALALAATNVVFDGLTAWTVAGGCGAAAVIVGILLPVYLALRQTGSGVEETMAKVARPWLTVVAMGVVCLGVTASADLPALQELTFLMVLHLLLAGGLTLLVLPVVIKPLGALRPIEVPRWLTHPSRRFNFGFVAWLVIMAVVSCFLMRVRFDGDMRHLNAVSAEVLAGRRARAAMRGNDGWAYLVSFGPTQEDALQTNEQLYDFLAPQVAPDEIVSLAPLLPSAARQEENRRRWRAFWSAERQAAREGPIPGLTAAGGGASPFGPVELRQAGLGYVVDDFLVRDERLFRVYTLIPDDLEIIQLLYPKTPADGAPVKRPPTSVQVVSRHRIGAFLNGMLGDDFRDFLMGSICLVFVLLTLLFRDVKKVLVAFMPAVSGLACLGGVMGIVGLKLNPINAVAPMLVIGLGAFYGALMVCRYVDGYDYGAEWAVLLSALTAVIGGGVLGGGGHEALRSFGLSLIIGVVAAAGIALVLVKGVLVGIRRPEGL